ncbi:hypothetical protein CPB86DRAFT_821888 [Serendipita vermifera]|nr:hypothetical protein CPB86DRAFT_821888 [Serendipita vermifera]
MPQHLRYMLHPRMLISESSVIPFRRPFLSTDVDGGYTPLPNNPDMRGSVVRLSYLLCEPQVALLTFSEEDDKMVVGSILLQNYGLLAGSLVFILLKKLSPDDIDFAISAIHSPIFHLLLLEVIMVSATRRSFGLFRQFGRVRLISQILMLGIIPLWIVLSGVTWVGPSSSEHRARQSCAAHLSIIGWPARLSVDVVWVYYGIEVVTMIKHVPYSVTMYDTLWYVSVGAIALGYSIVLIGLVHLATSLIRYRVACLVLSMLFVMIWGFTLGVYNLELDYDFQFGQFAVFFGGGELVLGSIRE